MIVDDELAARRGLRISLDKYDDVEVVAEAESVRRAKELLETVSPDVVLLDVEMPMEQGFSLKGFLPDKTSIIFVSAHSHYASKAFDVEALDYLVKPVRIERLREALNRAIHFMSIQSSAAPFLVLREQGKEIQVLLSDILALEADGNYTRFILSDQPPLMIANSIGSYMEKLPESVFSRIGRSLVINLEKIDSLVSMGRDASKLYFKGCEEPILLKRAGTKKLRGALRR